MEPSQMLFIKITLHKQFNFKISNLPISVVDRYKYLGVIRNETIDFNVIVNLFARTHGWAQEIRCILKDVRLLDSFLNYPQYPVDNNIWNWMSHIVKKSVDITAPKLRTSITHKTDYCIEPCI